MSARFARTLASLLLVALVAWASHVRADTLVPIELQTQLLSRLVTFDRNFRGRARTTARVLIVQRDGDGDSTRIADLMARGLRERRQIGGVTVSVAVVAFTAGAALAERCRAESPSIVYFSTGLERDMPATAAALAGLDLLTVGANGAIAEQGAIVGFDLEEGRPRIVVNLARARAQHVDFKAELLKLSRIVNP
jgi:YfiR/HmsC-like